MIAFLLGFYVGGAVVALYLVDGEVAPLAALCWPVLIAKGFIG